MTFGQAHAEMDILLDKADQPYFTAYEKDKFLNAALMEWFEEQASIYDASGDNANMLGLYLMQDVGNTVDINNLGAPGNNAPDQGIIIQTKVASSTNTALANPATSTTGTGSSSPYPTEDNPTDGGTRCPVFKVLDLEIADGASTYADAKWMCCKRTSMDQRPYNNGAFKDPFNTATLDYPKYFIKGGNIKITPPVNAYYFRLTYLTYPMFSNVSRSNSGGTFRNFSTSDEFYGNHDVELGVRCLMGNGFDVGFDWNDTDWEPEQGLPLDERKKIIKKAARMMTANIESTSYPIQRQEEIESR